VSVSDVPAEMRAAVLVGPRDLQVRTVPVPRPGPEEVLVRVAMCGACGTDVSIQEHPFPGQPPFGEFIPGHEWTGTVAALGESVDEFAVGDRVAIHIHHGCGRCMNCLRGDYTACLNYGNRAKGHRAPGFTTAGGFAQYVVHHVNAVYPIADSVSWEDAVLATTAGTAVYGFDRAGGLIAGDTVVVIGPGPVGLMTVQAARALGAARVILVGTRDDRLAMGAELGATDTIRANSGDPVAEVLRLTGGRGADLVVETAGAATTANQALHMARRGGKAVFLAFYKDPIDFDLGYANREEITLVTARGEGRAAVGRALRLIGDGRIRGGSLVTHRYALEDIQQGFDDLRARTGHPMKVVFIP
jgi:L-iditol 2-dehydrogenase